MNLQQLIVQFGQLDEKKKNLILYNTFATNPGFIKPFVEVCVQHLEDNKDLRETLKHISINEKRSEQSYDEVVSSMMSCWNILYLSIQKEITIYQNNVIESQNYKHNSSRMGIGEPQVFNNNFVEEANTLNIVFHAWSYGGEQSHTFNTTNIIDNQIFYVNNRFNLSSNTSALKLNDSTFHFAVFIIWLSEPIIFENAKQEMQCLDLGNFPFVVFGIRQPNKNKTISNILCQTFANQIGALNYYEIDQQSETPSRHIIHEILTTAAAHLHGNVQLINLQNGNIGHRCVLS